MKSPQTLSELMAQTTFAALTLGGSLFVIYAVYQFLIRFLPALVDAAIPF